MAPLTVVVTEPPGVHQRPDTERTVDEPHPAPDLGPGDHRDAADGRTHKIVAVGSRPPVPKKLGAAIIHQAIPMLAHRPGGLVASNNIYQATYDVVS